MADINEADGIQLNSPDSNRRPTSSINVASGNIVPTQSPLSNVSGRTGTLTARRDEARISSSLRSSDFTTKPRSLPLSQDQDQDDCELLEVYHECNLEDGSDDETTGGFSVPRYCRTSARSSPLESFTVDMENVLQEIAESGDGGDSDVEGLICEDLDAAYEEAELDKALYSQENDVAKFIDRNVTMLSEVEQLRLDADIELKKYVPLPPDTWSPDPSKTEFNEPLFENVDNPGNWCNYAFRPEFEPMSKGGKYKNHYLTTGARPVPPNESGERKIGDWTFHYDGWKSKTKFGRTDTTEADMFPDSRKGCLDKEILQKFGLTKEKMNMGDALFFFQLLLPICNPKKSGISGDPRIPYYSDVVNHSNLYACSLGLVGGQYSHAFKAIKVQELVHWDGILVRDGALGGSNGALFRRWLIGETMFDPAIHDTMSYDRFLQIKRTYKLCNNYSAAPRGDPKYNPAYKYDLIFKAMVHNCNSVTKYGDSDLCGDETTFPHMGYGEANTGLLKRLGQTKPGITRGMQTVMIFDVNRIRPRAYLHRHKCHPNPNKFPTGCNELFLLMQKINKLCVGSVGNGPKIFRVKPHSTWDNYFSGDGILDWLGTNGFGATMTCRRDRLPAKIKGEYLHKKKTLVTPQTKVARFLNPIVATKTTDCYERVHTSFQSTSSCNITSVNGIAQCSKYLRKKQRGQKDNKREWVIEMNDARALYLATYGIIDNVDKLIKYSNMSICSWKYWHAAMLHAKKMVCVIAYDMYLECSEGNLNPLWKVKKPLTYWQFRDKLGQQMLSYTPKFCYYAGDDRMRMVTSMNTTARRNKLNTKKSTSNRKRCKRSRITEENSDNSQDSDSSEDDLPTTMDERITSDQYKKMKARNNSRLCGDVSCLQKHINYLKKVKCAKQCEVCGIDTYTVCTLCPGNPGVHFFPTKGIAKAKQCYLEYHSDEFFGLAKSDITLFHGMRLKDWKAPTNRAKKSNAKYIDNIKKQIK